MRGGLPMPDITTPRAFPFLVLGTALLVSLGGVLMAEKMRWQGTPIGNFLKGSPYRPDENYHTAYDEGFRRAMEDASRGNWTPSGSEL